MRHVLVDARRGQTAIVLVTGVPGAGKTALLRWVHDAAGAAGAHVLRCSACEGAPPLSSIMRLFARLPALETVTTAGGRRVSTSRATGARLENLAAVLAAELLALGRRRLTLVMVDATQELDASSQVVLEHVVASLDDTAPAGDVNLFPVLAEREPVAPGGLAERAVGYDACRSVLLQSLAEHEVYEMLAQSRLHPRPPLVADVLEETGGLPLLVEVSIERLQAHNRQRAGPRRNTRVRPIADAVEARLGLVDRKRSECSESRRPLETHGTAKSWPTSPASTSSRCMPPSLPTRRPTGSSGPGTTRCASPTRWFGRRSSTGWAATSATRCID